MPQSSEAIRISLHLRLSATACSSTSTAITCNLPCHTLCNFERSLSPPQLGDGFWFYFIKVPTQILKPPWQPSTPARSRGPTNPSPLSPTRATSSHTFTQTSPAKATAMATLFLAQLNTQPLRRSWQCRAGTVWGLREGRAPPPVEVPHVPPYSLTATTAQCSGLMIFCWFP